jgi:hypothetical protein
MSVVSLGRLEKVGVRNVWNSEASNFTPWLAQEENLALLGEAIRLELELEAQEQAAVRLAEGETGSLSRGVRPTRQTARRQQHPAGRSAV